MFKFSIVVFYLIFFLEYCCLTQPLYYPPSYFNYPYNIPPLQTYNICPELLYYFNYEPLMESIQPDDPMDDPNSPMNPFITSTQSTTTETVTNVNQNILELFKGYRKSQNLTTQKYNNVNKIVSGRVKSSNKTQKFQSQIDPRYYQAIGGPFWEVISGTYEKCCPLNKNRLRPVLMDNDTMVINELFHSFANQTHILNHQSQGMFSILEQFNNYETYGFSYNNPLSVQILTSSGFYLVSKREYNGAPTVTPIALHILLKAWPILAIILLANAYAAILIWFLDHVLKTRQFPTAFTKGTVMGLFWSFFLFTATSLAPRFHLRTWAIRIFTIIWMMVSLVIIVIFIGSFTSSLSVYALNGEPLTERKVGFYKYSKDRLWLETENSIPVDFNNMNEMFRALEEQRIDYVLLDQIYANYYADIINEKFYVNRFVNRRRTYNVFLRGFNSEQLTCFQTTSPLLFQRWLKSNYTDNAIKLLDRSKYFDLTDALMYPQRNVILISAVGILSSIIIAGISWQITCMKEPGADASSIANTLGIGGGRSAPRNSNDESSGGRGSRSGGGGGGGGGGLNSILSNLTGGGRSGGGGGGGGGLANIGRQILGDNPITGILDNVGGLRGLTSNLLSSENNEPFIPLPSSNNNNNFIDRTIKFNPLLYYNNNNNMSTLDYYKKNLIDNQKLIENSNIGYPYQRYYQRDESVEKQPIQFNSNNQNNWSYFRDNYNYNNDSYSKDSSLPAYNKTATRVSNEYHVNPFLYGNNNSVPQYSRIPIHTSLRDKAIQTSAAKLSANNNQESYLSQQHQQYATISPSRSAKNKFNQSTPTTTKSNDITMYSSYTHHISQQNNNRFRNKGLNLKGGIVLNPAATSMTSIYNNHESNTDESIEFTNSNSNNLNNNNNNLQPQSNSLMTTFNNLDTTTSNNNKSEFSTLKSELNSNLKNNLNNSSSGAISISINSKNGTASILSNPTHKELPRHDTFYFNESVKL